MRDLSYIRIILENPQQSKNVGSVCRAMKNMGLGRLYIAGNTEVDLQAASVTAIHAADVLENAVYCPSVAAALEGTVFSAALSRRRGKKRKYFSIYPEELARRILDIPNSEQKADSRLLPGVRPEVGLVFGNEVSGLSEEDMALCNLAVMIPANEEFPSLNLSHAVQITAYEIYKAAREEDGRHNPAGYTPLTREEIEKLCSSITSNLEALGFFKQVGPQEMHSFFRDIFARAALSPREAERLKKIFAKIRGLSQKA